MRRARWRRTFGAVVGTFLLMGTARGLDVADGSQLIGNVRVLPTAFLPPQPLPPARYSHYAELNIYLTEGNSPSFEQIEAEIARAQRKFDACGIRLQVTTLNRAVGPPMLTEWESLEFNRGLTHWERQLFSQTPAHSAGIVFVSHLDWTVGRDGVTAIGYGGFVEEATDYLKSAEERHFFRSHVAGHAVLGRSIGPWTLTHELGHAVLGLKHARERENIMFSGQLARGKDPVFTEAQCALGRTNAPWVRPLPERRLAHLGRDSGNY